MKKRILTSSIITVLFAIIIVNCSFIALINIKEVEKTKEILKNYNNILIASNDFSEANISNFKINNLQVRFTIIDKEGNVLYDNLNKNLEYHGDRDEIIKAFNNGEGGAERVSTTEGIKNVYYAIKINDNNVIRSSVPLSTIKIFTFDYMKYYILAMILVVLLSIALSLKLVRAIIYPVKELETATAKIANGDLSKRAIIYTNDEIGSLAHNFNNMADQLQHKIKDALDKQDKLEAILESMESGVIAIDNHQNVMLVNPYVKKIFGINKNIIGENIGGHIIDYDIINFIKSVPTIETREIKVLHPVEKEIRIKKAPIIDTNGYQIGTVVVLQDITDIKRLENMRSQFVANVSHELKTPLTSIKGFAETLKYVEDIDTRRKFLDIIDKEAERLSRLINDILVLSNIENNHSMNEDEFNPIEVIEDAINVVRAQADKRFIKIDLINKNEVNLVGDKDKFLQLMLNLIENAVKYSEDNTLVKVKIFNVKEWTYIEVIDNGIGIPKEDLPRIFERFYRVDKSRATRGTGLGLAIVKHIVKMFNGDIFVESSVGLGSKFTVKIKRFKMLKDIEC